MLTWRVVLWEEMSGTSEENDSKSNHGSKLMSCILLDPAFPVCISLCSAFSGDLSVCFLLACYSKRSLCLRPACMWVCVCMCVSVYLPLCLCLLSRKFSLFILKNSWIAHLLQNTGPVLYFTYQSSHLLQVSFWLSYESASCDPSPLILNRQQAYNFF